MAIGTLNTADNPLGSAHAAIARGDLAGARSILRGLMGARSADAQHALAVVERRLGNLDAARQHFEAVLHLDPRNREVHNNFVNLALSFKSAGRLEDAHAVALRATQVAAGLAKAWHALGTILWDLRQLDAAADALDHALRLSPRDPTLLHARARVEAEKGGAALELYERALVVATDDPELVLGAAVARFEAGDSTGAIAALEKLTEAHPGWVKGHVSLAQLRWQSGDDEQFARSFETAVQTLPGDLQLRVGYFGTLMRAGRYGDVLGQLDRARADLDAPGLFDRYEAVCASEAGEMDRAEQTFSRLAAGTDQNLEVARVRHLLRTHRPREAAVAAERLTQRPDATSESGSYLSLAWRLLDDPRAEWLAGPDQFVATFDCRSSLPDLASLAEVLRRCHRAVVHPFDQSPRGGTQSDGNLYLHTQPQLRQLRDCLDAHVAQYVSQLPPRDSAHPFLRYRDAAIAGANSYSIWLRSGGFHINHVHPHSWISSCLYVDVPESLGADPAHPAGWLAIGQPPRELGLDLPALALIRPEPGKLVLFPSMMWHGSVPFPRGDRLTVVSDFLCAP